MVEVSPEGIGYGLVAVGVLLFLVEIASPGFFIAVPATILVILGVLALAFPGFSLFSVWAPIVVIVVGAPATFLTLRLYRRMAPPDDAPTTQTSSNLVGRRGIVTAEVLPDSVRGKVKVAHQSWSATTREAPIPVDAQVVIVDVDGVILVVKPAPE